MFLFTQRADLHLRAHKLKAALFARYIFGVFPRFSLHCLERAAGSHPLTSQTHAESVVFDELSTHRPCTGLKARALF
jgi:hypothetical protein